MSEIIIKDLTEGNIKSLGFNLVKQYNHDQYHTNRYAKECLMVEFTYEDEQLINCDLTIEEAIAMPISFDELKTITSILTK